MDTPRGLKGVAVADTSLGDVRGSEGFYHYRQYSAVELAERKTFEEVAHLMLVGSLPDGDQLGPFVASWRAARRLPAAAAEILDAVARASAPLEALRTVLSHVAASEAMQPAVDSDHETLLRDLRRLSAVAPTVVAAAHRRRHGRELVPPRPDLDEASNYLWMLHGEEPEPAVARALGRYLVLALDHGFNASTFTARVVTSTGADAGAAVVAAIGALGGPRHGGAPSRVLESLDAIGTPDRAEGWARAALARGERLMGFGHAVYRTADPRSVLLRRTAEELGGPRVALAISAEAGIERVLAEHKPQHPIRTNVEYYAAVVLERCGVPRELFTPTFAVTRLVGWSAQVLEQAADPAIIRPSATYVGPPAPQPVPA